MIPYYEASMKHIFVIVKAYNIQDVLVKLNGSSRMRNDTKAPVKENIQGFLHKIGKKY